MRQAGPGKALGQGATCCSFSVRAETKNDGSAGLKVVLSSLARSLSLSLPRSLHVAVADVGLVEATAEPLRVSFNVCLHTAMLKEQLGVAICSPKQTPTQAR